MSVNLLKLLAKKQYLLI